MASRLFDDYTPISSVDELEEIKRQREEQEEADANFREQRKKDEAMFGMGRVTGRNIGIAGKMAEMVGYTETEYELSDEVINAAVGESVAELNSMATGDKKTPQTAPTADITAMKSDMGSAEAASETRRQETLSVADRYFADNNVVSKGDRAKWISENKVDFIKSVFPNRWNDLQDEHARQKYVDKINKDREIERNMNDDYGWIQEGLDWLQVPENATLLGAEVVATAPSLGGATLLTQVGKRIIFDGAIAGAFEGAQAKQRYDTGISTAGEALTDTAIVATAGGAIGGGVEFLINSTGLRNRMSQAAKWVFNNRKNVSAKIKVEETAVKQKVSLEQFRAMSKKGPEDDVIATGDEATDEIIATSEADKQAIDYDLDRISLGKVDEVKNADLLEIENVKKLEGEDEGLFRVTMKGHDEEQLMSEEYLERLKGVIGTNKKGGAKELVSKINKNEVDELLARDINNIIGNNIGEVKYGDEIEIESVVETIEDGVADYKVKIKGMSEEENFNAEDFNKLKSFVNSRRAAKKTKRKLTPAQVAAIRMKEKMRQANTENTNFQMDITKEAEEMDKKVDDAVSCLLSLGD